MIWSNMLRRIGTQLARYLSKPRDEARLSTSKAGDLAASLQKGDVLLVEGSSRFSSAIKYLTQSSWSHAALFVGDAIKRTNDSDEVFNLVEADVIEGVRAVPLKEYESIHTRICRPKGLNSKEIDMVLNYVIDRIGHTYDLKNIFDLLRYFITTPPVPGHWKRRMLAFGSGDPTRAICSSIIAEAFQSIHYPILPDIKLLNCKTRQGKQYQKEIMHIRHHSLFAPRDFDISPYFEIIKPTLKQGFDFHDINLLQPHQEQAAIIKSVTSGKPGGLIVNRSKRS